jgi:hypothetical protein
MNYQGDLMETIKPPIVKDCYDQNDFEKLGFHDCHITAVRWNAECYTMAFDLDYIVQWVKPSEDDRSYRFWICPAELQFKNVDDVEMILRWKAVPLDCCMDELHRTGSRTTPNGTLQWQWALELSEPDGCVSLWATGFDLRILEKPILSNSQQLEGMKRGH